MLHSHLMVNGANGWTHGISHLKMASSFPPKLNNNTFFRSFWFQMWYWQNVTLLRSHIILVFHGTQLLIAPRNKWEKITLYDWSNYCLLLLNLLLEPWSPKAIWLNPSIPVAETWNWEKFLLLALHFSRRECGEISTLAQPLVFTWCAFYTCIETLVQGTGILRDKKDIVSE